MKVQKVVNGELIEVEEPNVDEDGTPKVELNEDGTPKVELNEDGTPKVELNEDGTPKVELNEDGTPKVELEPWQKEDPEDVPVRTHIHMKRKLKGRISEKDSEIETLQSEIAELKAKVGPDKIVDLPLRPKRSDFDSDELYTAALEKYDDDRDQARYTRLEQKRDIQDRQIKQKKMLDTAVDEHYERAGKLIEESGVDEELYRKADEVVRSAVEAIRPKQGDLIVDQLIQLVGEGSEKVFYFLGRSKSALTEVKSLLAEDPSGMRAAVYIGQQKERLLNPKKPTSSAPAPSGNPNGDAHVKDSKKVADLRKKYKKAHKDGDMQIAFDVKREARLLGTDTSKWHKEV